LATYLAPRVLHDLPETDTLEPDADEPDEGIIFDGTGIARLGYRCWTETAPGIETGVFLVMHRAVVWDRRGTQITARPAVTREAALNEALGRYLAAAEGPAADQASLDSAFLGSLA
jgi:hypothetical protein